MKSTKMLSLLLAVTLLLSLCVPVLASDEPHQLIYTTIGDSIPAGFGLMITGYDENGTPIRNSTPADYHEPIDNSYPVLVAEALNAKLDFMARCGFRATEARVMLEPGYEGDDFTEALVAGLGEQDMAVFLALKDQFKESIKESDVVTVNLGSNDTLTYALLRLIAYLTANATDTQTLAAIEDASDSGLGNLVGAYMKLMETAKAMGLYAGALNEMSTAMLEGYENFKRDWDISMDLIYKLNPNAKVFAVSMYNPFDELKLTDASLIHIGKLADTFVGLMNTYMKTLSSAADKYYYVDVTGTKVAGFPSVTGGFSLFDETFLLNVHPQETGHLYMASCIVEAVNDAMSGKTDRPITSAITNFVRNSALYKGFKDVISGAWYTDSVKQATELGIMSGYGDGVFMPEASIKLCEVIKMAAVSRSIYSGDGYAFDESAGESWYDTYLTYAKDKGIVRDGEYADLSAYATREQMAHLFATAMSDTLAAVNSVGFDGIPDVTGSGKYDSDILALYKAGIVEGRDGGYFDPASSITRAECAALIARICTPDLRIVK